MSDELKKTWDHLANFLPQIDELILEHNLWKGTAKDGIIHLCCSVVAAEIRSRNAPRTEDPLVKAIRENNEAYDKQ